MSYQVYKTTNTETGEMYIGRHSTDHNKDSYLGSGKIIKQQLKEYDRSVFHKEILLDTNDFDLACDTEVEMINHYMDTYPYLCMNMIRQSSKGSTFMTGKDSPLSKAVIIEGVKYGGVNEAARQLGIPQSSLRGMLDSSLYEYKDWYYKEKGPLKVFRLAEVSGKSKPVIIEGVEYASGVEAAKALGIVKSTVHTRVNSTLDKFKNWNYKK